MKRLMLAYVYALVFALSAIVGVLLGQVQPAQAQARAAAQEPSSYSQNEIIDAGHRFFGSTSTGLAQVVERVFSRWGKPNGYILGEEGSGALFVGARYGEGMLRTKNAGDAKVYWQGPSIGWDVGGDGNRTMMLVYNLNSLDSIYRYYGGVDGSAYLVGGVGMRVMTSENMVLIPIRTGLGLRLGVNVGYLKMTREATWNPF